MSETKTQSKWRKRPIEVDAVKWTGDNLEELRAFVPEKWRNNKIGEPIGIITTEGVMYVAIGDWIVRGAVGEYYPCKPDAFAKSFEPIETRTQEHTPTPWTVNRICEGMPTKEQWLKHCEECWDKTPAKIEPWVITHGTPPDHLHICVFGPGPANQENAAHIVHCVNSHATLTRERDSLREALKSVVEGYDRLLSRMPGISAHADFKFRADVASASQILSATEGRKA